MPLEHITTDLAPAALPGIYSQAVRAGNLVYLSGSVPKTIEGTTVGGTIQDRTRQVLKNLEGVLKGAGLTLKDVAKANIYLTDLSKDFTAVNEVWKEVMPEPKPARTCIGVKELPGGGTDVEIEFVAYDERAKL